MDLSKIATNLEFGEGVSVKRYFHGDFFVDMGGGNCYTALALERAGIPGAILDPVNFGGSCLIVASKNA